MNFFISIILSLDNDFSITYKINDFFNIQLKIKFLNERNKLWKPFLNCRVIYHPQQKYFVYTEACMISNRNKNYLRNEWNPLSKTSWWTIKNEIRSFIFNNAKDKRNPIFPHIFTMFALLSLTENDKRSHTFFALPKLRNIHDT